MTDNTGGTKVVNGWKLYAHPCFIDQLTVLAEQVEILEEKNGWYKVRTKIEGWVSKKYITPTK